MHVNNITNFFQPASKDDKLFSFLLSNKQKHGKNILLSPLIEKDLNSEQPLLGKEKFYSIGDINLSTGIKVINEYHLKGISLNPIYPSEQFTRGRIESDYDYFHNNKMLDIAGVNWVLMKLSEYKEYGPFQHLREEAQFAFGWKDEKWVMLLNDDSWGEAFLLNKDVTNEVPDHRINCPHRKFLCGDYENIIPYSISKKVNHSGNNGDIQLTIPKQSEITILGLSTMYRSDWQAFSENKKLRVFPLFETFIGIEIPPGVTNIKLDYNPILRIALMYFSFVTFILTVFSIIYLFFKEKNKRVELL